MRYGAHSGIAVLHGAGILEKGNQMAEPTSYIVEIDEQGNASIKYADGTPYAVNIAEYSAEVLKQLAPCKMVYTVTNQIDSLYIGATKGGQKFLLPYSPTELMETVEDTEDIHYMLDGTSIKLSKNGSLDFFSAISADIVAVDSGGNATVKESITELGPLHSVRADATFSEGLNSVECNVMVKIGELEFGPFSFVHDNIPGGDDDAKRDEDVALPEAD